MSEKKPWEELIERAKSKNDKNPFERMVDEMTDDMQRAAERENIDRGKTAIHGAALLVLLVVVGAALLGVAARVFISFAGL